MPPLERVLTAYERRLGQLTDEIIAEFDPTAEERVHLLLVTQLLQALVRTYDSFQISRPPDLEASTSVMYAAAGGAGGEGRRVLNVPLRSLVDYGTLSPAQARYLNGNLSMRRSVLIAGGPNVGKSTLLNALIGLLPGDLRLAVIRNDEQELPALHGRMVVFHNTESDGTTARSAAFHAAVRTRPDWLIVDRLLPAEGALLLEICDSDTGGLATVPLSDPSLPLSAWLGLEPEMSGALADLDPLTLYLERDRAGRPRIARVVEAARGAGATHGAGATLGADG